MFLDQRSRSSISATSHRRSCFPSLALSLLSAALLGACSGGGGSGNGFAGNPGGGGGGTGGGGGGGTGFTPGVFLPATSFQAQCAAPRGANAPNGPWPDVQGTSTDENNFLRSYSNDTYLWYDEIVDRDPSMFTTPEYFDLLITTELTPSGNFKDNFHFSIDTNEWIALSQSGASGGYGLQFAVLDAAPPRRIVVAFTEPNTPATTAPANLARGAEIIEVDGVDVVNGSDVDAINGALFPAADGETHSFTVRDLGSQTERSFSMTSGTFVSTPVQNVTTIPTATGDVGYLLFNDHIATAEEGLVNAIDQLDAANVTDLVVDLRYNGGGFLTLAAEFAYMIAGDGPTAGRTFELLQFNDKHPTTDPVTGQPISPVPFYSVAQGFSVTAGTALPTLDLPRVFVLTGSGTCSASEAIINGLRGANVEVIQIGSTTCGKPYGFYPTDNCGTTYFTIQFRGVNDQNFGDYADGFSPANTAGTLGVSLPGCSIADDFGALLGDPAEARLAAALQYREDGSCPAPSGFSGSSVRTLEARVDSEPLLPKSPWRENRIFRR